MKSFSRPLEHWQSLTEQFSQQLSELESHRAAFPKTRRKLHERVDKLKETHKEFVWSSGRPKPFGSEILKNYASEARSIQRAFTNRRLCDQIRSEWPKMRFGLEFLKSMHGQMVDDPRSPVGQWKQVENRLSAGEDEPIFATTPAEFTDATMNELQKSFDKLWNCYPKYRIILMIAYRVEFIAIHPFLDGNGRTSRMASMLLLYKSGHEICDLWNLENAIYRQRLSEVASLQASLAGWHTQEHDLAPYIRFFIKLLNTAYRKLEFQSDMIGGQIDSSRGIGV